MLKFSVQIRWVMDQGGVQTIEQIVKAHSAASALQDVFDRNTPGPGMVNEITVRRYHET
jgi:hypothetical protein